MSSDRLSAKEAGYMELDGAQKDSECAVVRVPGGVSSELGCCNSYRPIEGADEFKCGECQQLEVPALFELRHGETAANKEGLFRSTEDFDLDESGVRAAELAGWHLAHHANVKFIACSPLKRTRRTAAIAAQHMGITDVHVDPRLLPWKMPILAGKPKKQKHNQTLLRYLIEHPEVKAGDKGESQQELRDRFFPALRGYLSKASREHQILLVTHGTEVVLTEALINRGDPSGSQAEMIGPGGILGVSKHDGQWRAIPWFGESHEGTFGS